MREKILFLILYILCPIIFASILLAATIPILDIKIFIMYCVISFFSYFLIILLSIYRYKLNQAKNDYKYLEQFDQTYIEKLYKEQESLKSDIDLLKKENELLSVILLNPNGNKIN